jgi:hypothetical protein
MSTKNITELLEQDRKKKALEHISSDDYYHRRVIILTEHPPHLVQLITQCRTKLYQLEQSYPGVTPFDEHSKDQLIARIQSLESQSQSLPSDNPQHAALHERLILLKDLKNLSLLEPLLIPINSQKSLTYCTLAEDAGGVTEKISLVSLTSLEQRLTRLSQHERLDLKTYIHERESLRLPIEAILKLPKKGDVKEVQRESIALNMSRMLSIDTTKSFSVCYKEHPALLIPFESIRLLTEFSTGKKVDALYGFGNPYFNYSTIKALGNGLHPNGFVDDFGHAIGLMYLCSDTDGIGGHCQNKALKNARSLFVFDHVFMSEHKFSLDSRLSLHPIQLLMRHTRHGQGRNRSLIEDSSMNSKFNSIMQLLKMKDILLQYIEQTRKMHEQHIKHLENQLKHDNNETYRIVLEDLKILKSDADLLQRVLEERIKKINEVFPKTTKPISNEILRQVLIFEKLVNNPRLFTDEGRPYRNPWTDKHETKIETVCILDQCMMQLIFNTSIDIELLNYLKNKRHLTSLSHSGKIVTLSQVDVLKLDDLALHPEMQSSLVPQFSYLTKEKINLVIKAYQVKHHSAMITACLKFIDQLNQNHTTQEMVQLILNTVSQLEILLKSNEAIGLSKHLCKLFHLEAQVQLQKLLPISLKPKVNLAFNACLNLDRMMEFNQLIGLAILNKRLEDPELIEFLNQCIKEETGSSNFDTAHSHSASLGLSASLLSECYRKLPLDSSEPITDPSSEFYLM